MSVDLCSTEVLVVCSITSELSRFQHLLRTPAHLRLFLRRATHMTPSATSASSWKAIGESMSAKSAVLPTSNAR